MKLNVKSFAFAGGIVWGLAILVITYWFLIFGHSGGILAKLDAVYLGYTVTWYGAFIGLGWGFVDGFIGCAIFACLYNKFTKSPE
ncbi:MAG: hypothetical protein IMY69_07825 [Bacteroidetes bacterium]|jgi:hypothetical protein|nr:hypothetical protein [Bacteroidota bacterium]